jgi:prepilin-type N-terminal cleavage/methylation domain-containing protein
MKIGKSRKGGFTLVEIMIVVAIIGLLATIAIPNFAKARETTRKNACISNLRNIDGVIQQWALDLKKDSGSPVTYTDIKSYLKNDVSCPSGGTTFEDSYAISTVDVSPTCMKRPETHKMPSNN